MNHPILPCGYNSWDNDGDELNGAGVNEPIWPPLFDTFIGLEILLVTAEMMDIFQTGCPDLVFACENTTIVFPAEERTLVIGQSWSQIAVYPQSNTIILPQETRALKIKEHT